MKLITEGRVVELNEEGFKLDGGRQIKTMNSGWQLDLAVGEDVSVSGGIGRDGNVFHSSYISVCRAGEWIVVADKPRLPVADFEGKSGDLNAGAWPTFPPPINSIPVSFDGSSDGGTSIQTMERSHEGKWNLIVADAFPPPRKSTLSLKLIVSGVVILLVLILIGITLLRFIFR
jgi:hypothetical protein